jgi:hypothetical protein
METRAEISIKEIQQRYGIKSATAYKWRSALRNLSIEESWKNYDRINSREINLSEAAKETATTSSSSTAIAVVVEVSPPISIQEPTTTEPMMDSGFGLTLGRLQELNSEAELEVLVRSKLRGYHESQLQSQRSQELKSKIAEVSNLDPKNLGAMLNSLGVA